MGNLFESPLDRLNNLVSKRETVNLVEQEKERVSNEILMSEFKRFYIGKTKFS